MPTTQRNSSSSSDFDKLMTALSSLSSLTSFHGILDAFGLTTLPTAQKYGILFGILTFTLTVGAVVTLLVLGGSFERIKEQAQSENDENLPSIDPLRVRAERPLLLEWLLEARDRMMNEGNNRGRESTSHDDQVDTSNEMNGQSTKKEEMKVEGERFTNLTKMLLNVAPSKDNAADVSKLIDDDQEEESTNNATTTCSDRDKEKIRRYIPPGYEENYVEAYRKCQDKPGGALLSGLPEARYEAYARAYAGCGVYTTPAYRRSYARMYEAVSCKTKETEAKYTELFRTRPQDLVGRTVRLEPLEQSRHLQVMYAITCGEAYLDERAYDPNEVWGFLDCGPFDTPEELAKSFVFQRQPNEAAFAIVENVTDRVAGVVILSKDDPQNLNIQLELPIVKPTCDGTVEQIEACFLLLDRLFALGYRRVQLAIDTQHASGKKLPGRLGFTQEAVVHKHMIVKDSSRDSIIYGMLNSDWEKGARSFLFKKLHGEKAQRFDEANNAKEGERDEQQRVLKDMKAKEEEEAKKKYV